MTVHGRHELKWKKNNLYYKNKIVMSVEGGRVKWPDGVLSGDYYNLTRAKDHAVTMALKELNKTDGGSELEASRNA